MTVTRNTQRHEMRGFVCTQVTHNGKLIAAALPRLIEECIGENDYGVVGQKLSMQAARGIFSLAAHAIAYFVSTLPVVLPLSIRINLDVSEGFQVSPVMCGKWRQRFPNVLPRKIRKYVRGDSVKVVMRNFVSVSAFD